MQLVLGSANSSLPCLLKQDQEEPSFSSTENLDTASSASYPSSPTLSSPKVLPPLLLLFTFLLDIVLVLCFDLIIVSLNPSPLCAFFLFILPHFCAFLFYLLPIPHLSLGESEEPPDV